jgi:hypothetical protein
MKALDLHHWVMRAVLHHSTAMAIEMACYGGAFVHCHRLFAWHNCSYGPCYGSFKLMPSYYINLIGVTSLFVSYWLPPTTIDAVLATIVAAGQARFRQYTEVNKIN